MKTKPHMDIRTKNLKSIQTFVTLCIPMKFMKTPTLYRKKIQSLLCLFGVLIWATAS